MPSPGKKPLPNHIISDLHTPRYFGDFALQVNKAFTAFIKQMVPAAAVGSARGSGSSSSFCLLHDTQEKVRLGELVLGSDFQHSFIPA